MPEATPEISVVMATFMQDDFAHLRATLESIRTQSFRDFECLLVLDGPISVETHAWLQELVAADPRFRLLPQPENRGAAQARNVGIASARGRYIAICDADDLNHSERLEEQYRHIEETGLDLVGSWYRVIDDDGQVIAMRQVPVTHRGICRAACCFNPIGNSTVLIRTALLQAHPFPTDYRSRELGEDFDLWIQLLAAGYHMGNLPAYLVDFRMDKQFLRRRSGWRAFRRDWRNKSRAARLWPWWGWPVSHAAAFATATARLFPDFLLGWVYALRYRLRFRS